MGEKNHRPMPQVVHGWEEYFGTPLCISHSSSYWNLAFIHNYVIFCIRDYSISTANWPIGSHGDNYSYKPSLILQFG